MVLDQRLHPEARAIKAILYAKNQVRKAKSHLVVHGNNYEHSDVASFLKIILMAEQTIDRFMVNINGGMVSDRGLDDITRKTFDIGERIQNRLHISVARNTSPFKDNI